MERYTALLRGKCPTSSLKPGGFGLIGLIASSFECRNERKSQTFLTHAVKSEGANITSSCLFVWLVFIRPPTLLRFLPFSSISIFIIHLALAGSTALQFVHPLTASSLAPQLDSRCGASHLDNRKHGASPKDLLRPSGDLQGTDSRDSQVSPRGICASLQPGAYPASPDEEYHQQYRHLFSRGKLLLQCRRSGRDGRDPPASHGGLQVPAWYA